MNMKRNVKSLSLGRTDLKHSRDVSDVKVYEGVEITTGFFFKFKVQSLVSKSGEI